MSELPKSRRDLMNVAGKRLLAYLDTDAEREPDAASDVPRLTPQAIETTRMPRSRERILANLDDMYREAFERAKAADDAAQMAALDFAYRREQLYFEILLDVRDGLSRK